MTLTGKSSITAADRVKIRRLAREAQEIRMMDPPPAGRQIEVASREIALGRWAVPLLDALEALERAGNNNVRSRT